MPPLRRAWPLAAVAIFAVSVACDAATAQSRGGGCAGGRTAAGTAGTSSSSSILSAPAAQTLPAPSTSTPGVLAAPAPQAPGDRATSLPAVDAVLERRNPSGPIRRPRSVAGQPQRDGSERARRRRQELGRLHGLLGPRDAHDQGRVAVCLSAHPAGVSDGAVRRIAALQAAMRLNVSIPSRSAAIARCAMRSVSSMVVDNFNPGRTFGRPPEADPPLNVGQLGGTRSARCQSDLDGICPLTRSPTPHAASGR